MEARDIAWNLVCARFALPIEPTIGEVANILNGDHPPMSEREELETSLLVEKLIFMPDEPEVRSINEAYAQHMVQIGEVSQAFYDLYSSIEGPMLALFLPDQ